MRGDTPRDILDSYPPALRDTLRAQREELKVRQQSGQQTVGPWAPAATLTKPRKPRSKKPTPAQVVQMTRKRA